MDDQTNQGVGTAAPAPEPDAMTATDPAPPAGAGTQAPPDNLESVKKLAAAGEPLIDLSKSPADRAAEQSASQAKPDEVVSDVGAAAAKEASDPTVEKTGTGQAAADKAAAVNAAHEAAKVAEAQAAADAAQAEQDAEAEKRLAEIWRHRKLEAIGASVYYRSGAPHQDGHEGTTLHAAIVTQLHHDWSADLTVFPRRAGIYHVERAPLSRVDDPEDCGMGCYRPKE